MKKLKEEQATVEKILEMLKAGKDVRKGTWSPKEVCFTIFLAIPPRIPSKDDKERLLYNPSSLKTLSNAGEPEKTSISDFHPQPFPIEDNINPNMNADIHSRSRSLTLSSCLPLSLLSTSSISARRTTSARRTSTSPRLLNGSRRTLRVIPLFPFRFLSRSVSLP
jgi:hypothetical protein